MAVALHSENIEIQEEDGGDDEEEEDDDIINANVETKTTAQQKHPQKLHSVRKRYRLVGLGLGLLCVVQALLNIGLRLSLFSELTKENNNLTKLLDHLQSICNNITEQNDELQSKYNNLTKDLDHIQSRYNTITAERDELKRRFCESHGFTFGGGVCYYISSEKKTWEESRQYCRAKQSDLMVINSKEKQDFGNTAVNWDQSVWLGLTDREEEGVWKWVDGTPLTTPKYWSHREPNNCGDNCGEEDCGVLYVGGWSDRSCITLRRWLCERVI